LKIKKKIVKNIFFKKTKKNEKNILNFIIQFESNIGNRTHVFEIQYLLQLRTKITKSQNYLILR